MNHHVTDHIVQIEIHSWNQSFIQIISRLNVEEILIQKRLQILDGIVDASAGCYIEDVRIQQFPEKSKRLSFLLLKSYLMITSFQKFASAAVTPRKQVGRCSRKSQSLLFFSPQKQQFPPDT
jgi:hypothetical protein